MAEGNESAKVQGPSKPSPLKSDRSFFIVALRASAGGLAALENFFAHMPTNSGMSFVLIQHLSPFCCNRQLHAISSRARSWRFNVLQVRLQGHSLRTA